MTRTRRIVLASLAATGLLLGALWLSPGSEPALTRPSRTRRGRPSLWAPSKDLRSSKGEWASFCPRVATALRPRADLEHALALARPEGDRSIFVLEADHLLPLARRLGDAGLRRWIESEGCSPAPVPRKDLAPVDALSEREREVLTHAAAGLSNKEIGQKLFVSTGTIKTHMHNVLGKLGAKNRTEAVAAARARGLFE